MRKTMLQGRLVTTLFCCSVCAVTVIAQRRAPGTRPESKVPVTIALQVGSEAFNVTSQGTCHHTAQASIYDVPAEQWSVQYSEGSRSVSLTLWRPKKGSGDMLSLAVSTGAASHIVNTVKGGSSSSTEGSGTATLAPAGKGGTFTIDAATTARTKITGTIKCDAFTAPMEVAGD